MSTQRKNYIITNRASEGSGGDSVAPEGALTFTTAALGSTSFAPKAQGKFVRALDDDLVRVAAGGDSVSLCVFFHGFSTTWAGIQTTAPQWFTNLRDIGGYPGVLLAFDWPSGDSVIDFEYAKSNAEATAQESFPLLAAVLDQVIADLQAKGITVELQFLCHSMGNYLMWQGAGQFAAKTTTQTLLVAPELSDTAFAADGDSCTPCEAIADASGQVSVYYSSHDNVLPWAPDLWRVLGQGELGLDGPNYDKTLYDNVTGVCCSAVVNSDNATKFGATEVHTAYFSIPEVLQDMAQALMGQASSFRSALGEGEPGVQLADQPGGAPIPVQPLQPAVGQ